MNPIAVHLSNDLPVHATSPGRLVLRALIKEVKYECVRALRSPAFAGPFLLIPVALYLFFGVVLFGEVRDRAIAASIFSSFCVLGVMGPAMFGFGIFTATEREQGLLNLRRALPAPPAGYLIAKTLMAGLFAALIMASMFTAALTLGRLKFTLVQAVSASAILIAGALPFSAMGLYIGTRASAKSAPAFVNLAYLPMIYLSGMIPLPKSIQFIHLFSPAFYLDQLAHKALWIPSYGPVLTNIAVLAAVTLALGVLAVRRMRSVA